MTKYSLPLLLTLGVTVGGCSFGDSDAGSADSALESLEQGGTAGDAVSWRQRVAAELDTLRANDAPRFQGLNMMAPVRGRAGQLRLTTMLLGDPAATAALLDRLDRKADPADVRAALAEALPRTSGAFADALLDLLSAETDPAVRAMLVSAARQIEIDSAVTVLAAGLADSDAGVRTEAAHTAGFAPEAGARLVAPLTGLLEDAHPATRSASARALGLVHAEAAVSQLAQRLSDPSADVRLEALRALQRIDRGWLKTSTALRGLAGDSDSRVSALARTLVLRPTETAD